jgi:hypothetical protein
MMQGLPLGPSSGPALRSTSPSPAIPLKNSACAPSWRPRCCAPWRARAAVALLFGKALAPQEVPALALVIGGIAFVGLYAFGIILVYLGEGE